jgi:hypothetical protein
MSEGGDTNITVGGCGCFLVFILLFLIATGWLVQPAPRTLDCAHVCRPVGVARVSLTECVCNEPCPTTPETPTP